MSRKRQKSDRVSDSSQLFKLWKLAYIIVESCKKNTILYLTFLAKNGIIYSILIRKEGIEINTGINDFLEHDIDFTNYDTLS